MQTTIGTPSSTRGAIGRCRGCAQILPLRWPTDNEESEEWVCTGCGQRYRGVLIRNLQGDYGRNVRSADSTRSAAIASDLDLQAEALLNPACVREGQPHPITIAFPDRPKIVCDLENTFSRDLDHYLSCPDTLLLPPQESPFAANVPDMGPRPYHSQWVRRVVEQVAGAAAGLKKQFSDLAERQTVDLAGLHAIVQDQLAQIIQDKDVFTCLGIQPHSDGYPSRHALQVSMLAMSMGMAMQWDTQTLTELGVGCLIHDASMLALDESQYGKKGVLSAHDLGEIAKHTVLGLAAFERRAGELSERSLLVAYQMHERCNGTGYPRGYTVGQIHPLARVAALADVFVALVSPRPHRPGMVPYHAIKKIMQDTQLGLFDKEAFRALLDTVSIFPIGSFIALNDGRVGRVLRPNAGRYDRPVVEVWRQGSLGENPAIVDLADQPQVAIANSLARLEG